MDIIVKCLSKERDKAREITEAIVDAEMNYLFTNDSGYKSNRSDISPSGDGGGGDHQPQRGGNAFVFEMRKRIDAYFEVVLRSVRDSIPKAIGYFLVHKSQDMLQMDMYNQVNNN